MTNKEKGNLGIGIAIAYFTTNSYTVSIPLNDTQDYDLVVEKDNVFKTVQVKTTGCKTKYGSYQVALKSCGGTKGRTYKTVIDTNIDLLFVVSTDLSMYLIPKDLFMIYVGPFILILINSCIKIIKNLKKKEKVKTEYIMAVLAIILAFVLSYLSGYIFFNSSLMIILSAISIYLLLNTDRNINKCKIGEEINK